MARRTPGEYVGSASEDNNDPVIPAVNAKVSFSAPATRGRFSNTVLQQFDVRMRQLQLAYQLILAQAMEPTWQTATARIV